MLDKLLEIAKNYVHESIENTQEIPNDKKDSISNVIIDSIEKNIQEETSSGFNFNKITNIFNNKTNSEFYQRIETSVISSLTNNVGLDPQIATTIATTLLPNLINKISSQLGGSSILGSILNK